MEFGFKVKNGRLYVRSMRRLGMYGLIIILILFNIGCGNAPQPVKSELRTVDVAFQSYNSAVNQCLNMCKNSMDVVKRTLINAEHTVKVELSKCNDFTCVCNCII